MSGLLHRLYSEGAFNPALPQHELAAAHIPFGQLGAEPEPETLLLDAVAQTDGITIVLGASGAGKSSLMTYCAEQMAELARENRRYLPLFVPVAPQGGKAAELSTFGRLAISNLLDALPVPEKQRSKLDRIRAEKVSKQLPTRDFNARLALKGGLPSGLVGANADFGLTLRGEVTTLTGPGKLDHDPYGGLAELAHVLRGLERELVVMIEDTDAWAFDPDGGLEIATAFFGGVLAPLHTPGFSLVVAAQTAWTDTDAFAAINERAIARIELPTYRLPGARDVIFAIVASRASWSLGEKHTAEDVLEPGAVDVLAAHLASTGSVRASLTLIRDALSRVSADPPEKLSREHLLETA